MTPNQRQLADYQFIGLDMAADTNWEQAILEDGTLEELRDNILWLPWCHKVSSSSTSTESQICFQPVLYCPSEWRMRDKARSYAQRMKDYDRLRAYAMQTASAIVFSGGTYYDLGQKMLVRDLSALADDAGDEPVEDES